MLFFACKMILFRRHTFSLKILRKQNNFSPCAKPSNRKFLLVIFDKDDLKIAVKISLGK